MKVLIVHNRYSARVPSGENVSVASEIAWLRRAGIDVHTYQTSNDELLGSGIAAKVRAGPGTVWSRSARHAFTATMDRIQPDLVHIHNLFPLMSASVPWAALRQSLPVVWTVRNRRVTCIMGGHFRDGAPCHACRPGWRAPGIRFGCYNDSTGASALLTAGTSIFRSMARRHIEAVAISTSMRNWLIDTAGFPADRVHVKYNGVEPPADRNVVPAHENRVLLFTGKLVDYKGVDLLLDAWEQLPDLDAELRFVGDGPLAPRVKAASERDGRITYAGAVDPDDLPAHLAEARVVVTPSLSEEPFGRSAAEALAYGRPVITTGLGGLSEVVDDDSGWITGTEPDALASALSATASDDEVTRRARAALDRHHTLFSPESTTRTLIQIYERALQGRGRTSSP